MRLRLLLIAILAVTLLANAAAEGDVEPVGNPDTFGVLANATLSCSARLPSVTVGCFLERPVLTLGPLEFAVGVDAQAALTNPVEGHVAAYGVVAWYAPTWSAWLEVHLPQLGVPTLGAPDWIRLGFTLRL